MLVTHDDVLNELRWQQEHAKELKKAGALGWWEDAPTFKEAFPEVTTVSAGPVDWPGKYIGPKLAPVESQLDGEDWFLGLSNMRLTSDYSPRGRRHAT